MYLGIDLGGTNIAVGLVDEKGKIVKKSSSPTGKTRPADEIIADIAALCKKVVSEADKKILDVKAIGIGCPGTPDVISKRIMYMNNFTNFDNIYIEKELHKFFPQIPVYLENDANAAALGEMLAGTGRKYSNAVIITIGTGVGSGVVLENKIYAGFNHAAAEIGHMVINFDGEECTCGRRGCFEAYASATALIRQTKQKMKEHPESKMHEIAKTEDEVNGRTAFDAAKMGDEAAARVVSKFIEYLGAGISNTINIFQPEAVVIGGGVSKEGEYLLKPLREYVRKNTYGTELSDIKHTEIVVAELGNDAGIIGAAMLFTQY